MPGKMYFFSQFSETHRDSSARSVGKLESIVPNISSLTGWWFL